MNTNNNGNGCCWREKLKRCFHSPSCANSATPLSKRGRCGRVKICKVIGDRALCGRFAALGVYPGAEADIISSDVGSCHILKVKGGTVSLGADISDNIIVTSL